MGKIEMSTNAVMEKAEDMIGKRKKKKKKVKSTIDPAAAVEAVVDKVEVVVKGVTKKVEDVVEGVTNKVKQTLSSKIEMSTNAVMEKAEDMIGKRRKKKKVKSTIDPAAAVEDVVKGVTKKVEDVVEGVTN